MTDYIFFFSFSSIAGYHNTNSVLVTSAQVAVRLLSAVFIKFQYGCLDP